MNITGNPVKFEKSNYKKNMITQMTQPVKRKYDVLLERSSGGAFQNRAKGVYIWTLMNIQVLIFSKLQLKI